MSSGVASSSISYPHHHHHQQHQHQQQHHHNLQVLRGGGGAAVATTATTTCYPATATSSSQDQKDFSRPLHVDCSVEYELPNAAKPPQGVRNEPLLMIHPCYFRKIESQRRSPFVNNLPSARIAAVAPTIKRSRRGQQVAQQAPQQAAPYPTHHHHQHQLWDPMVPITTTTSNSCCKPYSSGSGDSGHWTDPDRSPDRPDDKQQQQQHLQVQQQQRHQQQHQNILSGKYRQYLRAHRLHPYVGAAIPLAFPQVQQVCYNV